MSYTHPIPQTAVGLSWRGELVTDSQGALGNPSAGADRNQLDRPTEPSTPAATPTPACGHLRYARRIRDQWGHRLWIACTPSR
jgi:hypothetical protein